MNDSATVSCPHASACGACALLSLDYAAQLAQKREICRIAIHASRALAGVEVLPCMPSPRIEGYRNRAKMAVSQERRAATLGYFRTASRELVDAPDCRVLEPALLETTRQIRALLPRLRPPLPELRFVDVRSGSNPRSQHLTLVLGAAEVPRIPYGAIAGACPSVRGISVNLNPDPGPQVLRGPVRPVWGARGVVMEVAGVALQLSAASFFQVNLHVLPAIHARMRAFLEGSRTLADLYAGVGTHALALAGSFRNVLAIEGVPTAVRDARASLEASGIKGVTLMAAPVERSLGRLVSQRADAVVLNPPRAGASIDVLRAIGASEARRLAYLSCDPETLAQDLETLVRLGFDVASVEPIDMMPQTRQVEALALLSRATAGRPVRRRSTSRRVAAPKAPGTRPAP